MHVKKLDDIPLLETVLTMQRAMSGASSEAELFLVFSRGFYKLSGATELIELSVQDLPAGSFRLTDHIDLDRLDLCLENIRDNCRRDTPLDEIEVRSGGLLGELIQAGEPQVAFDVVPGTDALLDSWVEAPRDLLSVPVFFDGAIAQWMVVLRPAGQPVEPIQIRVTVAILNMLARAAYQLRLLREIRDLHGRLEDEMQKVATVQRSILPRELPSHPLLDIAVHYRPSAFAGGDYYDFREFDDGSIGFVIADVAGHGPSAAVVMAMMRAAMSIDRRLNSPGQNVATRINEFIFDGLHGGTFVTAFFLRIYPETGQVFYANAGHLPPYLRRADGTLERLDASGSPPLGILQDLETGGGEFELQAGDTILLHTDGVVEGFNATREQFGESRLCEAFTIAGVTAGDLINATVSALDSHVGTSQQSDDECLVAIRLRETAV